MGYCRTRRLWQTTSSLLSWHWCYPNVLLYWLPGLAREYSGEMDSGGQALLSPCTYYTRWKQEGDNLHSWCNQNVTTCYSTFFLQSYTYGKDYPIEYGKPMRPPWFTFSLGSSSVLNPWQWIPIRVFSYSFSFLMINMSWGPFRGSHFFILFIYNPHSPLKTTFHFSFGLSTADHFRTENLMWISRSMLDLLVLLNPSIFFLLLMVSYQLN